MEIQDLESQLNARYSGSYDPGHMGSQILRFEKAGKRLVVKFASSKLPEAIGDIKANIYGYQAIKMVGAESIVPSELQELSVPDGQALSMLDLGDSIRKEDAGFDTFGLLWQHFEKIVKKTKIKVSGSDFGPPEFAVEVINLIKGFSNPRTPELMKILEGINWSGSWGNSSLMILDFTPDNLFISNESLLFIDPWQQKSYLGHPAVSIGQFATLAQIYEMRDSKKGAMMLRDRCLYELPFILECDTSMAEIAFRLGVTLQFVLSSYVRQDSNPELSEKFFTRACEVWE